MERLEPAGFLARIISSVFPKRLEVELRTEVLPDGNVEFVPIYRLGGKVVPGDLVSASGRQEILGHVVTAGPDVAVVQRETGGQRRRYSKRNAAEVRKVLEDSGTVLAVFQGHSHQNGYKSVGDIHYATLVAMVEDIGETDNGYAVAEVTSDGAIHVRGLREQAGYDWKR